MEETMIINIVKGEKTMTKSRLRRALSAVQKQIDRDFTPYWGMPCMLREGPPQRPAGPEHQDSCVLYIQKKANIEDALGYHDRTARGVPFGFVFLDVSLELGEPWTVTLSHEVLEMIADPHVNVLAMGPHPTQRRSVFHWYEMCDAVQAQTYNIDGTEVSNFLLPFYFTVEAEPGPCDFLKSGVKSFKVAPGGYVGFFDPDKGEHVTYAARGDKQAQKRMKVKAALGPARRSNRYKSSGKIVLDSSLAKGAGGVVGSPHDDPDERSTE
jgi:hypothetical protein